MSSSLSSNFAADWKEKLPIGYRFNPFDDQVIDYLRHKIFEISERKIPVDIIPTILNGYKLSPDELPLERFEHWVERVEQSAEEVWMERQWFFYTTREEEEEEGRHVLTKDGYWFSSESATEIEDSNNTIIGFKQTIHFYEGILPNGIKSNWTIYQYRLNPNVLQLHQLNDHQKDKVQNFVACRIVFKEKKTFDAVVMSD